MGEINLPANNDRETKASELRRGIRSAQLRVALDQVRGRETPDSVVRLSKRVLPRIIQPGRKIRVEDRTDAAAKAMSNAWRNMHTNEALGFQKMLAQHALDASDAVMFSDESVERVEAALEREFTVEQGIGENNATAVYGTTEEIVRAVIAALKDS